MDKRFSVKHIVMAIFHKSDLNKDGFNLALAISKKMEATFSSSSPTIIPGKGAPPEIPRVIYKSANGIKLTVSQKITSLQLDVLEKILPDKILCDFVNIGNEAISLVVEDFASEISRIGVVLIGKLDLEGTGAEFIRETYLKGYSEELFGSEVHWLTYPVLSGEKINRWVRIKSDSLEGTANKFVDITIDSNIMHELERTVSGDYARDYLKMVINDILDNFNAITKIN